MKNTKYLSIVMLIASVLLSGGCSTSKVKHKYPADISDQCHGAKNAAKACILSKGVHSIKDHSSTVRKIPGQWQYKGIWGWNFENLMVLGLNYGTLTEVGCNPTTGGEVNSAVLTHEFGHHWLTTNGHDVNHDPIYKSCFFMWNNVSSSSIGVEDTQVADNTIQAYQVTASTYDVNEFKVLVSSYPTNTVVLINGIDAKSVPFCIITVNK